MKLCLQSVLCHLFISNFVFWLTRPKSMFWAKHTQLVHYAAKQNFDNWLPCSGLIAQSPVIDPWWTDRIHLQSLQDRNLDSTGTPVNGLPLMDNNLELPSFANHRFHFNLLLTGTLPPLVLAVSSSNFGLLSKLCTPRTARNEDHQ